MDLYLVLGVTRESTADEIKKNYRQIALQNHPDKNPGKEAEQRFKEAAAAYEILGDPIKRSLYDLQGYVGRRPPTSPHHPKPTKSTKPPPKPEPIFDRNPEWEENYEPSQSLLDSISCMFMESESSGRSILVHASLTAEQLRNGCDTTVTIKRRKLCRKCAGDGYTYEKCPKCNGKWQATRMSVWNVPESCPECGGSTGKQIKCPLCKGEGLGLWEIRYISIKVPPNSHSGYRLSFFEGEDGPKGKMPGRLHVTLVEKP